MATALRPRPRIVPTEVACLVFITDSGDDDRLIELAFSGDTPREAEIFAQAFNLALAWDSAGTPTALIGPQAIGLLRAVKGGAR